MFFHPSWLQVKFSAVWLGGLYALGGINIGGIISGK